MDLDQLWQQVSSAPAAQPDTPETEEDTEERVVESIGRGIVTAPISLAQGITEFGAMGLDAALGTNMLRPTTEWFEGVREGVEPTGAAGRVTEEVVAFGLGFIPIAGWLGRASHVARTGKSLNPTSNFMRTAERFGESTVGRQLLSSRAGLYGTTAAAVGLYEGVFSPSGRETLSDGFEIFPDALKTEQYSGEVGRAEAARQFRNRMRQAAEASALSAGFDTLLYGLGEGARAAAAVPVINESLSAASRGLINVFDFAGRNAARLPGAQRTSDIFNRYFTSTRGVDPTVSNLIQDVQGLTRAEKNDAARVVSRYENAMARAVNKIEKQNGTPLALDEANLDINRFFEGAVAPEYIEGKYGTEVLNAAEDMVQNGTRFEDIMVRQLENVVLEEGGRETPRATLAQQTLTAIQELQQGRRLHLSRMFQVHQNPLEFYRELDPDFMTKPLFRDVVEEVMAFNTRQNPDLFGAPGSIEFARQTALEVLGLPEIAQKVSPQKAITDRLNTLKREFGGTRGVLAQRTPMLELSDEMLIARKDLITNSPALRELMGEIKDPSQLFLHTINRLSETTSAYRFYRDVMAPMAVPATSAIPQLRSGVRPLLVSVPDAARATADEFTSQVEQVEALGVNPRDIDNFMKNYGYRRLGDYNPGSAFGGQFGDLSGQYVQEELYDSLVNPVTLGLHPVGQAAAIVNQVKGLSQKMLIVPNLASRVRDILGSMLMRVATGNAPSLYRQDYLGAAQVFLRDAANLDEEGLRRMKFKLDAAGVTDSNVMMNFIRQFQAEGPSVGAAEGVRKFIDRYQQLPGFRQVLNFFETLTDNVDAYSKATVMLGEEAKLNEIFSGAKLATPEQRMAAANFYQRSGVALRTRSEVLEGAAREGESALDLSPEEIIAIERTKQMMPTYSQIGSAVRTADRALPFGNFTSFASENIRNISNIFSLGLRELATSVDDQLISELGQEAAESLVRLTRASGAQRLMSLATIAAVMPKAMVRASMNATGTTDQQMERIYEQGNEFLLGHDLLITENDGEGRVRFVDLSYVAPYAFITDAVNSALQVYSQRGRLDASEVDQLSMGAFAAIASLAEPFASESIVFERVRDALPASGFPGIGRGGRTDTGALIYREEDDLGTKVFRGFVHVLDSLAPAFLKLTVEGPRGDIEPGRLTRAMLNTPGARGQDFNFYEEMARQVTGFTPMEINLRRDFEFSGLEYSPRRSSAKTAANNVLTRADSTVPEMISGWNNYLDILYREQSRLYNDILGARELGLSEQEIRRNLITKAKLGAAEVTRIMNGEFFPGLASQEIGREVREQLQEGRIRRVESIPFAELNQLSNERRGQTLSPELFRLRQKPPVQEEAVSAQPEAGSLDALWQQVTSAQTQGAAPAAPVVGQVPAAPGPQPAAQQAETQPPLELLGGSVVDALRNLPIAQRLSGQ